VVWPGLRRSLSHSGMKMRQPRINSYCGIGGPKFFPSPRPSQNSDPAKPASPRCLPITVPLTTVYGADLGFCGASATPSLNLPHYSSPTLSYSRRVSLPAI